MDEQVVPLHAELRLLGQRPVSLLDLPDLLRGENPPAPPRPARTLDRLGRVAVDQLLAKRRVEDVMQDGDVNVDRVRRQLRGGVGDVLGDVAGADRRDRQRPEVVR